jgi:hypothetical protein
VAEWSKLKEYAGSSPVLTTNHSEPSMVVPKSNIGGNIKVVTAWKDKQHSQVAQLVDVVPKYKERKMGSSS